MTEKPELLTVNEAAELFGCTIRTIYHDIKRGRLPHYRVGRKIRIDRQDLLVKRGEQPTEDKANHPKPSIANRSIRKPV